MLLWYRQYMIYLHRLGEVLNAACKVNECMLTTLDDAGGFMVFSPN